jgi:hypothetical protein
MYSEVHRPSYYEAKPSLSVGPSHKAVHVHSKYDTDNLCFMTHSSPQYPLILVGYETVRVIDLEQARIAGTWVNIVSISTQSGEHWACDDIYDVLLSTFYRALVQPYTWPTNDHNIMKESSISSQPAFLLKVPFFDAIHPSIINNWRANSGLDVVMRLMSSYSRFMIRQHTDNVEQH